MSMTSERPSNTRKRHFAPDTGPSLAKQSSKDECDINFIMKRYAKTGILEHLNEHQGDYGDFSDAKDFTESQKIVLEASEMFDTIPASIRKQFENSPAKFLDFVQDSENQEAMIDLGLATRVPPDPSIRHPATTEKTTEGSGSSKEQATEKPPAEPKK